MTTVPLLSPTHPFRRCRGPEDRRDDRLRIEAVDSHGERMALATVDRTNDHRVGELTLDLAPGCHSEALAAELVRRTVIASTIDGVRRLVVHYDGSNPCPAAVLAKTQLPWRNVTGGAELDLPPWSATPIPTPPWVGT